MKYRKVERTSPSNIILFLSNYKEWYQRYILGIKIPDNVYFQFGTAFHGLLEDFFNDKPLAEDTIQSYTTRKYSELFKKWFEDNNELIDFFDEEKGITMKSSSDWTYNYLKQWVTETLPLEKKYGCEKAFDYNKPSICEWHLEDEGLKCHGYMDSFRGKDKYNSKSAKLTMNMAYDDFDPSLFGNLVVDFKTSKVDRNTNNTKYALQSLIYALMYSRRNKRNKIQWICIDYVKYNEKFFYFVTQKMLDDIQKLIEDYWKIVDVINENPEKYFDSPPEKLKFGDYLQ